MPKAHGITWTRNADGETVCRGEDLSGKMVEIVLQPEMLANEAFMSATTIEEAQKALEEVGDD